LRNGRRIESTWNFRDADLARVIRALPRPSSMFGLSPATKIYIALDAIDMRKGFDGLYDLVRDHLCQDPLSGHLFLFTNRTIITPIASSHATCSISASARIICCIRKSARRSLHLLRSRI
jgi:transposase